MLHINPLNYGNSMPPTPTARLRRPGRPPDKQREILVWMRRRILVGELAPGAQLPTRRALGEHFGASLATVQLALNALVDEGFIAASGTQGTYVHAHPPHLAQYVLVFPCPAREVKSNRFWSTLEHEAACYPVDGPCRVRCVYWSTEGEPSAAMRGLLEDVRQHRVAGVVFASDPWIFQDTPMLDEPGVARAAVMPAATHYAGVAAVDLSYRSWLDRALDHLVERGRRRVALLTSPMMDDEWHANATGAIDARGLESHPYWRLLAPPAYPQCARSMTHLLMQGPAETRPDALLIADDNLVEHAIGGLLAAGMQVPTDIDVVAHCNFPWTTPSVVPVKLLGFDAAAVLRAGVAACVRQRETADVSPPTFLPAVFQDELASLASSGDAFKISHFS